MKTLENIVSIQIPAKDFELARKKLQEVQKILHPYLITLTPEERKVIPKMSNRSVPFVEKVSDYAKTNPELGPAYLDVEELEIDLQSVRCLSQLTQQVQTIRSSLGDTAMLAGSEAYVASLAYYNSVKGASKLNIAGAKSIYDDLKTTL
ncbi:hypothetical protein [Tunicatimonas pelagia]|uniref:hypothetical protein n=1 Tax=Tunicatimonas pelagia TaxID=931531 RepID=UPI002666350E|nr:hypothetical protein [Tunicatimonas pelagia]WKN40797.1 hypothetical protein P0M28_17310 [Tunicatimonas pelagia]